MLGIYSCVAEEPSLPGCNAVSMGELFPVLWRITVPSSSGSSSPRRTAWTAWPWSSGHYSPLKHKELLSQTRCYMPEDLSTHSCSILGRFWKLNKAAQSEIFSASSSRKVLAWHLKICCECFHILSILSSQVILPLRATWPYQWKCILVLLLDVSVMYNWVVSRLYASPTQIAKNETVWLAGLYPLRHSMLVLVDTTVPLACLQPQHMKGNGAGSKGISSNEGNSTDEEHESLQGTDTDSLGPVRNQTVQQREAWALV
jgi:hypothetical protein